MFYISTQNLFQSYFLIEQDIIKVALIASNRNIAFLFMITFCDCLIIQIYAFNDVYLKIYSIFVSL